jgi:hypothetical protein
MARSNTAAGVPAYDSEAEFTGPQVWASFAESLRQEARKAIMPILANKGQTYGVKE